MSSEKLRTEKRRRRRRRIPNRVPGVGRWLAMRKRLNRCSIATSPSKLRIDASYYRYRDNDDGVLERLEGPIKEKIRREAVEEWNRLEEIRREARKSVKSGEMVTLSATAVAWELLHEEEEDVVEEERKKEREMSEKLDENERRLWCMCLCSMIRRLRGWCWRRKKWSS